MYGNKIQRHVDLCCFISSWCLIGIVMLTDMLYSKKKKSHEVMHAGIPIGAERLEMTVYRESVHKEMTDTLF